MKRIDAVLRRLPDDLLDTLKGHYITREHSRRTSHYRRLDRLHYTLQGALLMLDP